MSHEEDHHARGQGSASNQDQQGLGRVSEEKRMQEGKRLLDHTEGERIWRDKEKSEGG